jgi:superfamily II DNA helicase RecQ
MLRKLCPKTPILACTATATGRVQQDVREILEMRECQLFKSSFNRTNLIFEVRPKTTAVVSDVAEFIKSQYPKGSGIVYCLSRCERSRERERSC